MPLKEATSILALDAGLHHDMRKIPEAAAPIDSAPRPAANENYLLINAFAPATRPPLVAIAKRVADAGCNIAETRVAAVGNDGPAAPPAYPASYPGVLAITGVDAHHKALIEAGHALHLDYAAPGADMLAATPGSGTTSVRGTSFAAPLAAGRLAVLTAVDGGDARRALDSEAIDLGAKGPDKTYGRGLVCGGCATRP